MGYFWININALIVKSYEVWLLVFLDLILQSIQIPVFAMFLRIVIKHPFYHCLNNFCSILTMPTVRLMKWLATSFSHRFCLAQLLIISYIYFYTKCSILLVTTFNLFYLDGILHKSRFNLSWIFVISWKYIIIKVCRLIYHKLKKYHKFYDSIYLTLR